MCAASNAHRTLRALCGVIRTAYNTSPTPPPRCAQPPPPPPDTPDTASQSYCGTRTPHFHARGSVANMLNFHHSRGRSLFGGGSAGCCQFDWQANEGCASSVRERDTEFVMLCPLRRIRRGTFCADALRFRTVPSV